MLEHLDLGVILQDESNGISEWIICEVEKKRVWVTNCSEYLEYGNIILITIEKKFSGRRESFM